VIRTLQDRGLVDVVARGEGLGRPLLYGTTQRFLEHFGFRSLEDLPRPEELPVILSERAPLEEEAPPEETSELAPEDEPAESELGVEEVLAEPESETPDSGPNGGGNDGGHVAGEPEEIQDPEDTDRD
jgi:segregation and condensation protein B